MPTHIANMGALTAQLTLQRLSSGEATMELSASLTPGPINVAEMNLDGSLTGNNSNLVVAMPPTEANLGELNAQYNVVNINQPISAGQNTDDGSVLNESVGHSISIGSSAHKVTEVTITQPLGLSQEPANALLTPLTVAQALAFSYGWGFEAVIAISHALSYTTELIRTGDSEIIIDHGITGYKELPNGTILPIPAQEVCEDILTTRPANFLITELDSLDSVEMKQPDIGDTIQVESLTVDQSSRGLIDLSFVPTLRSQYIIRNLPFTSISNSKKNEFQVFLKQYLGKKMSITTPEGTIVNGYVINPEAIYTDNSAVKTNCPGGSQLWDFDILFLVEDS